MAEQKSKTEISAPTSAPQTPHSSSSSQTTKTDTKQPSLIPKNEKTVSEGDVLYAQSRYKDAENAYRAEVDRDGENVNDATLCKLADMYLQGIGDEGQRVEQNAKEAVRYYQLAADQSSSDGQKGLGFCYENGIGVEKDLKAALKLYKDTIHLLSGEELHRIGMIYFGGLNYKEAMIYFRLGDQRKSIAAKAMLGLCYYQGMGIDKNYEEEAREEGLNTIWEAACGNDALANSFMGQHFLYIRDNPAAKLKDFDYPEEQELEPQGIMYCLNAIEYGYVEEITETFLANKKLLWGIASAYLGIDSQPGTAPNYAKGFEWAKKSAENGEQYGKTLLAHCYFRGKGTPKDIKEAERRFSEMKTNNNPPALALCDLGEMYYTGQGFPEDKETAVKYFEKAFNSVPSVPAAGVWLGRYYHHKGEEGRAKIYLEAAAKAGDSQAGYILKQIQTKSQPPTDSKSRVLNEGSQPIPPTTTNNFLDVFRFWANKKDKKEKNNSNKLTEQQPDQDIPENDGDIIVSSLMTKDQT